MPRYVHQKRVERAVDDRIAQIYQELATSKGWIECPTCQGHRQVLDPQNKPVRCPSCRGIGHVPPPENMDGSGQALSLD